MQTKTALYKHQQEAVEKLSKVKVGALYMEQGTGKTRTALELIKKRADKNKVNHILWLCPCTAKANIARDIEKHADLDKSKLTICGIETLSSSMNEYVRMLNLVQSTKCYLVVDESLLVKNPYAIRTRRITDISKECEYKLLLNGTPISKTEADLYSQWKILDPRILGYQSYWSFAANHLEFDDKFKGMVRKVLNKDYLTDKIAPYSFEVKKSDCLNLLAKREYTQYFSLTEAQEWEYEWAKMEYLSPEILNSQFDESVAVYRALNALQQITSGRHIISKPKQHMRHKARFDDPRDNPRIQMLLYTIDLCDENQIIIWCRFDHEIQDIETVLKDDYGAENVCLLYGALNTKKRQSNLDRFASGAKFLIANKACASFSLNLQYCHIAIYYNNDWDWATRQQSEDRIHRIGQNEQVEIIDICANRKIDERILTCLAKKERMTDEFKRLLKQKNLSYTNLIGWIDGREIEDDTNRIA